MARRQAELLVEALRSQTFVLPTPGCGPGLGWVVGSGGGRGDQPRLLIDARQAWPVPRRPPRAHPGRTRSSGSGRAPRSGSPTRSAPTVHLYAQPILELQTNRHPPELLLRVLDERTGAVADQVLDTAERWTRSSISSGWVERPCSWRQDRRAVSDQTSPPLGRHPRLTAEVERLIKQYAVNPERLTFEITRPR